MKIQVKQEHIKQGDRMHVDCCPVALAIKDATGRYSFVDPVLIEIFKTESLGNSDQIKTPKSVADFIHKFDAFEPVKPFEFELEIT